jgi:hypothetical protein
LQLDVNGYTTGWTANNDGTTGSIVFLTDTFAIAKPGSAGVYPFIVGSVGGVSTVGVNGALVVDGSVTANKINTNGLDIRSSTGVVIFSSTQNLDVSRVAGLGGFATLSQITSGNISTWIQTGAIGNAYIGSFLQSADFNGDPTTSNPGTVGWYLGKSGTNTGKLYLNDVYVRGNVQADSLKANTASIVNTVHIAGNAVTTRLISFNYGSIAIPGSGWVTLGTVTVTISSADYLPGVGYAQVGVESGGIFLCPPSSQGASVYKVSILRGGTEVLNYSGVVEPSQVNLFEGVTYLTGYTSEVSPKIVENLPAGTYTYIFRSSIAYGEYSAVSASNRSLTLEIFRR